MPRSDIPSRAGLVACVRRLVSVMAAKGVRRQEAERAAAGIMRNPKAAADTFARDVLGINPKERGGN